LIGEKLTSRDQIGVMAFMPKSAEAFTNVFSESGSKRNEPTVAQTKEVEGGESFQLQPEGG
jgi:hypothetical protein